MVNYRIRSHTAEYIDLMDGFAEKEVTYYFVERRILWFWWVDEIKHILGEKAPFTDYSRAEYFVKTVRAGKLLYTI